MHLIRVLSLTSTKALLMHKPNHRRDSTICCDSGALCSHSCLMATPLYLINVASFRAPKEKKSHIVFEHNTVSNLEFAVAVWLYSGVISGRCGCSMRNAVRVTKTTKSYSKSKSHHPESRISFFSLRHRYSPFWHIHKLHAHPQTHRPGSESHLVEWWWRKWVLRLGGGGRVGREGSSSLTRRSPCQSSLTSADRFDHREQPLGGQTGGKSSSLPN